METQSGAMKMRKLITVLITMTILISISPLIEPLRDITQQEENPGFSVRPRPSVQILSLAPWDGTQFTMDAWENDRLVLVIESDNAVAVTLRKNGIIPVIIFQVTGTQLSHTHVVSQSQASFELTVYNMNAQTTSVDMDFDRIPAGTAEPDLIISDIMITSTPVQSLLPVNFDVTVRNMEPVSSSASFLDLYIDGSTTVDTRMKIPSIGPASTFTATVTCRMTTPGFHSLSFMADGTDVVTETMETNNDRTESFLWDPVDLPDLIITNVYPITPLMVDSTVGLEAVIRNLRSFPAGVFSVGLYVEDMNTAVVRQPVSSLPGMEEVTVGFTFSVGTIGPHDIMVRVDDLTEVSENDENNNEWLETLIFTAPMPDLVIHSLSTSTELRVETPIDVDVMIENRGQIPAGSFHVNVAVDGIVSETIAVSSLAAVQSTILSWSLIAMTGGSHLITAIVDPDDSVAEYDELNNVYSESWYFLTLDPDLVIGGLTIEYTGDRNYMINATVENIGIGPAFRFYASLYVDDNLIPDDRIVIPYLAPGENFTAVFAWNATASSPEEIRVKADSTNVIAESNETNNNAFEPLFLQRFYIEEFQVKLFQLPASIGESLQILVAANTSVDVLIVVGSMIRTMRTGIFRTGFIYTTVVEGVHELHVRSAALAQISVQASFRKLGPSPTGTPDLIVTDIEPNSPLLSDTPARIGVVVMNPSTTDINGFIIDLFVDSLYVTSTAIEIAAGETRTVQIGSINSGLTGQHTVNVIIDSTAMVSESDEMNNVYSESWTWVQASVVDLSIPKVWIDSPLLGSTSITTWVTIENLGNMNTDYSLSLFLDNVLVTWKDGVSFQPGRSVRESMTFTYPPGYYSIIIEVEGVSEPDLSGNRWVGMITLEDGLRPDLLITTVVPASMLMESIPCQFTMHVKNQGTANVSEFMIEIFIDGALQLPGTTAEGPAFGEMIAVDVEFIVSSGSGPHTIRFVLDHANLVEEQNDGNNEMSQMYVFDPLILPDLLILDVEPISLTTHGTQIRVTIRNQGVFAQGFMFLDVFMDNDPEPVSRASFSSFSEGLTISIELIFDGNTAGTHEVRFMIDSNNAITEVFEENNGFSVAWNWIEAETDNNRESDSTLADDGDLLLIITCIISAGLFSVPIIITRRRHA